jgi:hypothetical protein
LPVKTIADAEYKSSSLSFDLPHKISQNFCTAARISADEISAATAEDYHSASVARTLAPTG